MLHKIFLIVFCLAAASCGSLLVSKWEVVTVEAGKFSVECPENNVLMPDDELGYLICKGADADYIVHSEKLDHFYDNDLDDLTYNRMVMEDARAKAAEYGEIFSSEAIESNGRTVQQIIVKEKLLSESGKRNWLYEMFREKERLLVFEQVFASDGRRYILTVRYLIDDPAAYKDVLERNRKNRERFLNSFKILSK